MISIHYLAISLISFLVLNIVIPKKIKINLFLAMFPLISTVFFGDSIEIFDQLYLFVLLVLFGYKIIKSNRFVEESGYKVLLLVGVFLECKTNFSNLTALLILCLLNMIEISNLGKLKVSELFIRQKIGSGLVIIMLMGVTHIFSVNFTPEIQLNSFLLLAFVTSGVLDSDYKWSKDIVEDVDFQINKVLSFVVRPYVFIKILTLNNIITNIGFNKIIMSAVFFIVVYFFVSSQLRKDKFLIANRVGQINIISIFLTKIYYPGVSSGYILVAILLNLCLFQLVLDVLKKKKSGIYQKLVFGMFFAAPFSPFILYKLFLLTKYSSLLPPAQASFYILIGFIPVFTFPFLTRESQD